MMLGWQIRMKKMQSLEGDFRFQFERWDSFNGGLQAVGTKIYDRQERDRNL